MGQEASRSGQTNLVAKYRTVGSATKEWQTQMLSIFCPGEGTVNLYLFALLGN